MRFPFTLSLGLATLALPRAGAAEVSGSEATVRRFYDEALLHGEAYAHLSQLVARYPGRLSGSDRLTGAIAWGTALLRSMGLDKVYQQPVMVPHWVRGGPDSVILLSSGGEIPLTATALGGSVATPGGGLTAEVVELHGLDELEPRGAQLAGKIVFFNRPMDPRLIAPMQAYAQAGDQRNRGPAAAAKYGVAAVLTRSLTESLDDIPHTGTTVFAPGHRRIPAAALSTLAADRLSAALRADPHARVRLVTHGQMLPDAPAANVIGEIAGSEFPRQILLVGGHLDSWDIAPGANDDGTGIVQSIEVLRLFQATGVRPRHTLRCVLFVNEENGSAGANAYAAGVRASGERHVVALETDSGGGQPRGFNLSNLRRDAHVHAARWLPLLAPYGISFIDYGSGGADVEPLATLGITVGEPRPDSQRYFDYHHTRNDRLENVNPRELEIGAGDLAALLWLIDSEGL